MDSEFIIEEEFEEKDVNSLSGALESLLVRIKYNGIDEALRQAEKETDYVHSIFGTTPLQSALFAVILNEAYNGHAEADDLTKVMQINNIRFISMRSDLDTLIKKRLVRESTDRMGRIFYRVPNNVVRAVSKNSDIDYSDITNICTKMIFKNFFLIFKDLTRGEININMAFEEITDLMVYNKDNHFVKWLKKLKVDHLDKTEQVLAFYMMHRRQAFSEMNFEASDLKDFIEMNGRDDDLDFDFSFDRSISLLQSHKIIECVCNEGLADSNTFKLTEELEKEAMKEVLEDTDQIEQIIPRNELVRAKDIPQKKMFYNEEDASQIKILETLLSDKKFSQVQKRLEARKMRTGFCCLFHGAPGTGKTETALQIARKTGRDIYMVDITKLKSKWVGESEQAVRQLFKNYNRFSELSVKTPILLFNEADAIFGLRKEGADSSVDKMNNAIQNIILQEMENIKGIMIATTNLTRNFDTAFERRFLYKVEFHNPDLDSKSHIWRSMVNGMKVNVAETLAAEYDFSGGQIENIARKIDVDYILHGRKSNLDQIRNFCDQESISGKSAHKIRIGFN